MNCLCCSDSLLQHVARAGVYWFCPTCRQAMPRSQPSIPDSPRLRRHGRPPFAVEDFEDNND